MKVNLSIPDEVGKWIDEQRVSVFKTRSEYIRDLLIYRYALESGKIAGKVTREK